MKADISIIICTRNRAESLQPTLESIGQAIIPTDKKVELVIVDNGSTDHTKAVIEKTHLKNIQVRYIFEEKTGVSHAKNTGLRETSTTVVLFTDDDLRVPPNWIERMCRPILEGKTDAIAGGVVFPRPIEEALKASPLGSRRSWVACTAGLDPINPARMVGANMAFHRRVLEKVPGFDSELGPGALGFSEETLFSQQLIVAGFRIIAAFDVAVEHHFDITRLTHEGLLDIARKMGRSNAFLFHHWEHRRSRLFIPRLIICRLQLFGLHCTAKLGEGSITNTWSKLLKLEEEQAFICEYLVQRKRRLKYAKHGLVPVIGY